VYFKVAPRQTISAAVLPKVRTPLVLHYSHLGALYRYGALGDRYELWNQGMVHWLGNSLSVWIP